MSKGSKLIFLLALFVCATFAQIPFDMEDDDNVFLNQTEVERINSLQRTWEAGIADKFLNVSMKTLRNRISKYLPQELSGRVKDDAVLQNTIVVNDTSVQGRLLQVSSTSFDARTRWPSCVGPVRNQKQCGACWSFATVESFEDRLCVAGRVSPMVPRSAQYLLDCAPNQNGCNGGYPNKAWSFLVTNGAPADSCYPYAAVKKSCPSRCSNGAALTTVKAKKVVTYSSVSAVKSDLQTYGPVETWMAVYSDLYYYRSGVYQPTTNSFLGYHAVKVIGWGYDTYYGNYWIAQNSWGASWGEKGFFRIKAGTCMFDNLDHFVAGYV
jgi:cathepsin B